MLAFSGSSKAESVNDDENLNDQLPNSVQISLWFNLENIGPMIHCIFERVDGDRLKWEDNNGLSWCYCKHFSVLHIVGFRHVCIWVPAMSTFTCDKCLKFSPRKK